jgi:hypothetical protein
MDTAIERAEVDAREYAEILGHEYVGLAQAFLLSEDPEVDGAEVFSLVRDSNLDPDAYLDRFFDTGQERQMDGLD